MRRAATAGVAAALALLAAAAAARADEALEARFFDRRARAHFEAGRYREALRAFLLAQTASPGPRTPFNVAASAELAGEPWLAYAYFTAYLEGPDDDPERRLQARARLDALAGELALVWAVTTPPGATVYVDEPRLGAWGETPLLVPVPPGRHDLVLQLADHEEVRLVVEAVRGETVPVVWDLVPHRGRLEVRGRPAGGSLAVWRDGERVAHGGDRLDVALPVGTYRVRYERAGHLPAEREATVRVEAAERLTLAARRAAAVGRVLVTAGEVRAEVWLDGARVAVTPVTLPRVPEGRRRVALRAPGHRPWSGWVEVAAGRATIVRARLEPAPP